MSHLPPDPYKILGVHKDANTSQIRSAYKKLALKCHPDKVQDPKLKLEKQDEFHRVVQAYELLSDDREREKYNNQVRLADLRKQFQSHAANQYYAPDPAARPRGRSSPPPMNRNYYRSWDDDAGPLPSRVVPEAARPPRKDATSYVERPSKRTVEREREKEKDRERRRNQRRAAEQEAKEQHKADRKQKERLRDKTVKRESDDKKRYAKAVFTDSPDDEPPKSKSDRNRAIAEKHIEKARSRDSPSLHRQSTLPSRHPRVPSPPPMPGQPPLFGLADDNLHRPGVRQRRGSEGSQWASWARHKSRDDSDFPPGAGTPKQAKFTKSASATAPAMAEAPPPPLPRQAQRHTMGPMDSFPPRPPMAGSRSPPFSPMAGYAEDQNRGRQRSRKQSQIREEEPSDVYADRRGPPPAQRDYERYPDRERDYDVKHHRARSSRVPDDGRGGADRYPDSSGRFKFETFTTTSSRRGGEPHVETKTYYSRPPMTGRGSSFNPANVRHSKLYSQSDVLYGDYPSATGIYA